MSSELVEKAPFFVRWRPNRSLSDSGRRLWLVLIGGTTLLIATVATAFGAWFVLPFAGVEVMLVFLAFRIISHHDDDCETLLVQGEIFRWELRRGASLASLSGNRRWLQVSRLHAGHVVDVHLRYSGKCVSVGQFATAEQRRDLYERLNDVLR